MRLSLDQHQQRPKVGRGTAKWHIKKSASKPEMSPTLNVTLEQRTFSINVTKNVWRTSTSPVKLQEF